MFGALNSKFNFLSITIKQLIRTSKVELPIIIVNYKIYLESTEKKQSFFLKLQTKLVYIMELLSGAPPNLLI